MSTADEILQKLHRLFEQREQEARENSAGANRVELDAFLEIEAADVPEELREKFRRQRALLDRFHQMTTPPAPAKTPSVEDVQDFCHGRYEILRVHDSGGLGVVYVAHDKELRRQVAVKGIRPEFAANHDHRGRFHREAKITGSLEHPGIVPVYGLGADDRGQPYYAMKFIEGESLSEAIKRSRRTEASDEHGSGMSNIDLGDLLDVFVAACETVAFAHSRGVVHRDIKPDNILLGGYGEVLVVDWGLAKTRQDEPEGADSTRFEASNIDKKEDVGDLFTTTAGSAGGTPLFMSPEQARSFRQGNQGEIPFEVGPASDIYSLGASLYQILTGRYCVAGRSRAEVLAEILEGRIAPIRARNPEVPRALEAICLKALAFKPEDRYGSAKELAADLRRFRKDQPVDAWPDPWHETLRRWIKEHRVLVTTSFVTLLVTSVLLAIGTVLLDSARRAEQTAKDQLATANESLEDQNIKLRRPQYVNQIKLVSSLVNSGALREAEIVLDSTDNDLRGYEWSFWKDACRKPLEIQVATRSDISLDDQGRAAVIQTAISNDGTRIAALVRNVDVLKGGFTFSIRALDVHDRSMIWEYKTKNLVRALTFLHDDSGLLADTIASPAEEATSLSEALKNLNNHQDGTIAPVGEESDNRQADRVVLLLGSTDGELVETMDNESIRVLMSGEPDNNLGKDPNLVLLATRLAQQQLSKSDRPVRGPLFFKAETKDSSSFYYDLASTNLGKRGFANYVLTFEQAVSEGAGDWPIISLNIPEGVRLRAATLNSSSTLAATAHSDGTIRVWRVPGGFPVAVFPSSSADVDKLAFSSRDDRTLVWSGKAESAADNRFFTSIVPNLATTKVPVGWPEQSEPIAGFARSGDGKILAFVTRAGTLQVWNTEETNLIYETTLQPTDPNATGMLPGVRIALHDDGSLVAVMNQSTVDRSTLAVWDVASGKQLWTSDLNALICFVGNELVAFEYASQEVVVFDALTGEITRRVSPFRAEPLVAKLGLLACDPIHQRLIGFGEASDTIMYRMRGESLIHSVSWPSAKRTILQSPSPNGFQEVTLAKFTSDGSKMIVAHKNDSRLEVWDTRFWRILALLDAHQGRVTDFVLSDDENRVVSASLDGTIKLWDVQTGTELLTLQAIDRDRRDYWFVAFGGDDQEILGYSGHGVDHWSVRQARP